MRRLCFLMTCFFLAIGPGLAQDAPAATLQGVVVDADGRLVAGATVRLMGESRARGAPGVVVLTRTVSGADGSFAFGISGGPGRFAAVALKDGLALGWKDWSAEKDDSIRIVLSPGARIEGVVVDKASGKPAAGVEISARVIDGDPFPFPVIEPSAQDGSFHFGYLPAGRYEVALAARGPANRVAPPLVVSAETGKTVGGLRIEFVPGGTIEVVATDARDGAPVEGAEVKVTSAEGPPATFEGRTGADGIARLRLPAGAYRAPDVSKDALGRGRADVMFVIVGEGQTQRFEVRIGKAAAIRGVVRDEAGEPVEGATVMLIPASEGEARSNADGSFSLPLDPDRPAMRGGRRSALLVRHAERKLVSVTEIQDEAKPVAVTLHPGVALAGKVVDPEGKAIAGARLEAMLRWGGRGVTLTADGEIRSDEEGCYVIGPVVPDENYDLFVSAEGYGRATVMVSPEAKADGRTTVDDVVLPPANLTVSGVVVDDQDKPVANATVAVYGEKQPGARATTDAEGKFTVKGVCEGELRVGVRVTGPGLWGDAAARAGDKDVKIVVRRMGGPGEPPIALEPPTLTGKPLPKLDALNLKLDADALKGKRVLLCFWDDQQRPSRHCMQALEKRADELAKKDVVVVPVAVGALAGDVEETCFDWGVRGLPWLILADGDHVVRAEGFALDALDENLEQLPAGE